MSMSGVLRVGIYDGKNTEIFIAKWKYLWLFCCKIIIFL